MATPGAVSVEEAVVGSGDAVESEGCCCPDHCNQYRDPVAAPLGTHPPAAREVDGCCPDDEQVN